MKKLLLFPYLISTIISSSDICISYNHRPKDFTELNYLTTDRLGCVPIQKKMLPSLLPSNRVSPPVKYHVKCMRGSPPPNKRSDSVKRFSTEAHQFVLGKEKMCFFIVRHWELKEFLYCFGIILLTKFGKHVLSCFDTQAKRSKQLT